MKKTNHISWGAKNLLRVTALLKKERARLNFGKRWRPKKSFDFFKNTDRTIAPIFSNQKNDITSLLATLRQKFPQDEKKTLHSAQKILKHQFQILGFGDIEAGEKIDWHRDFIFGHSWDPNTHFTEIKSAGEPGGYEIKIPWELSRFGHLIILGKAYLYTKDKKYARETLDQISAWIKENPVAYGVNWACPMDVAIRVANWLMGYNLIRNSGLITPDFETYFQKSLGDHGRYLSKNLEIFPPQFVNNHAIAEYTGLFYLGLLAPQGRMSKKWEYLARRGLVREMKRQIQDDGTDFEGSTSYHCQVLEFFLNAVCTAISQSKEFDGTNHHQIGNSYFGPDFMNRLYQMLEFVAALIKPNKKIPLIGDHDSGGLHHFSQNFKPDGGELLSLGAVIFRESNFKIPDLGYSPTALMRLGREGLKIWEKLNNESLFRKNSFSFPSAGIFVMRSKRDYLVVSAGMANKNNNGGHCHSDKLSFELNLDGQDIIIDPGSYIYTGDHNWRNRFRDTTAHNSVRVDSKEQVCFISGNLFMLKTDANIRILKWKSNETQDSLDLVHEGYLRLKHPVTHQRTINFNKTKRYWFLQDTLQGSGQHHFSSRFHLAPKIRARVKEQTIFIEKLSGQPLLLLRILTPKTAKITVSESWISQHYGDREKGQVILIEDQFKKQTRIEYLLQATENHPPA